MEEDANGCDFEKVKTEPSEEFHKRIDKKKCELFQAAKAWRLSKSTPSSFLITSSSMSSSDFVCL